MTVIKNLGRHRDPPRRSHGKAREDVVALAWQEKRPGESASTPLNHAKMLHHLLAYKWSQVVGCFEQRASRTEGPKTDAKHEFEPMRAQLGPRATLPNTP
jgi:hypothetical protein